ncbi:ABC transporter ATP-binding protein [Rhizobium sp. BK251]|uniref:ABC transporter ATP-binding protein n=1 Tax=Rhizobium sp. BK251 TaxID=2512125 RepID=UPI0010529BDE|nr:ABC transporter ATP-binding protein [Rhizobium sp. BK251]TCL63636.1 spermidine/putrescine transport system ATP-binding protein [Rhizobium sp. BK251]
MSPLDIELVSVSKSYGGNPVVHDINLQIPRGEFVSLLGPSGCGKTTTLNMIAGFNAPTHGDIRIRGSSQRNVPPERRNIGLVFQNYALFPHMTVAQNVGFGLKMRGASRSDIDAGIASALRSVHLLGFQARYPRELSGGQQQRVALARAIAPRPSVLLLDEPLSNLDLKLREAMRSELKEVQEELGMTFVYVTHDQEEAMAMSDRIVVMWKGEIAQQGDPASLYAQPSTSFVAEFIGKSNILPVAVAGRVGSHSILTVADSPLVLKAQEADERRGVRFCSIRPEAIRLLGRSEDPIDGLNRIEGTIRRRVNLGAHQELHVATPGGIALKVLLRSTSDGTADIGDGVVLGVEAGDVKMLSE